MKKTIYTLNINDFSPEITALTYPLIEKWAHKIGADFYIITERKWPDRTPVFEKFQVYDLQRERGDDWSIFIDSDALVHPDFFDPTELVTKDFVMHNGADFANNRFVYDRFFRRDGRNIGSCTWLVINSDWCRELWEVPTDLAYEQAIKNIHPIMEELNTVITAAHLIDDYLLSRNIAKYGLHFTTVIEMIAKYNIPGAYLWHQYTITQKEKVKQMLEVLSKWNVGKLYPSYIAEMITERAFEIERGRGGQ